MANWVISLPLVRILINSWQKSWTWQKTTRSKILKLMSTFLKFGTNTEWMNTWPEQLYNSLLQLICLAYVATILYSVCLFLADGATGWVHSSSNEQPAQLFSPGAAEPQRRTATFHHSHHWLSVALHTRQTLEADCLPLTECRTEWDRQVQTDKWVASAGRPVICH